MHVQNSFNNTILSLTDTMGAVKAWTSGGTVGGCLALYGGIEHVLHCTAHVSPMQLLEMADNVAARCSVLQLSFCVPDSDRKSFSYYRNVINCCCMYLVGEQSYNM